MPTTAGYFVDEADYAGSGQQGLWSGRGRPLTFADGQQVRSIYSLPFPLGSRWQVGLQLYGDPDVTVNYNSPSLDIDFRASPRWNALYNRNDPPSPGMVHIRQGGGWQELQVAGQFLLGGPQGMAEAWGYDFLAWLGGSYAGELMIHNQAFRNCYFRGGSWSMVPSKATEFIYGMNQARFGCLISYDLLFLRPVPYITYLTDPPNWQMPAEQLANGYFAGGTRTDQANYRAVPYNEDGSVSMLNLWFGQDYWQSGEVHRAGYAESRSISVDRSVIPVHLPPAQGAYNVELPRGRTMTMETDNWKHATWGMGMRASRKELEEILHNIHATLQDRSFIFAGNGNEFTNCRLISMEPIEDHRAFAVHYTATIQCQDRTSL